MADILNFIASGNLTQDATSNIFSEKEKTVFNFTIASNLSKNKTVFLDCNYWINTKDMVPSTNEKKNIVDYVTAELKKGKRITIQSDYLSIDKSENTEKGVVYQNLNITVNKIVF